MKTKLTALFAVAAFALAPALFAADDKKSDADKKDSKVCEHCKDSCKCEAGKCACEDKPKDKDKKQVATGSLIPQHVKGGRILASASPLTVVSGEQLMQTGEVDLARALRKVSPALR